MSSFYSPEELAGLGLKAYGTDVLISRKASLYGVGNIRLGSHVRIDDFCVLSGHITVGNHVHIAAASLLFAGKHGINIGDYSGISSRCCIYAESDDYSGEALSNPTVPEKYTLVTGQTVNIGNHAQIGAGCTLLPGAEVADGCTLGAMSLLSRDTEPWGIYFGNPARRMGQRDGQKRLELARQLEAEENCAKTGG